MQYQNGIHPYEHALPAFGNRFRIRRYPPLPSRIGQYRLTRTLGSGAFGVVKEGVHRRTGEKVAIKLIRKEEIGHRPGFYTEIEREIEILEELDHGNIIKFKGVCQTEDHIAIVLEYVGGGELYSYLLHCGRFDEGHARLLFSQIVSGVQYMHRKNIVHRDLKMENILMVDSRHLKIADFGLAKRFCPGNDMSQTRCGTALYAAPEQYLANRVYASLPADIWSCGVILYTMVCGHTPFQDDAADDTGRRLYQRIRAAPLIFPTFVSRELQDLIRRMLVVNPSRRCTIEDVVQHPWLRTCQALFLRRHRRRRIHALCIPPPAAALLRQRQPPSSFSSSQNSSMTQFHSHRLTTEELSRINTPLQVNEQAGMIWNDTHETWMTYRQGLMMTHVCQQMLLSSYLQPLVSPYQRPTMSLPAPGLYMYEGNSRTTTTTATATTNHLSAQQRRDEHASKTCFEWLLELIGIVPRLR